MNVANGITDEGGSYDVDLAKAIPHDAPASLVAPGVSPVIRLRRSIEFITLAQLQAMHLPPWLVKKVIRRGELVVVYGEAGCGKTFVVIDLLMSIAGGRDWWDYQATPGSVLYLAGEGSHGVGLRCEAWGRDHSQEYERAKENVRILPHAVAFMIDAEFEELLDALRRLEPKPDAIAIDTLARHLPGGDENSAKDMGIFVDRCDRIREATGAAVIVVHHKGKDAKAERGSSALRGAADVMLVVEKKGWDVTVEGDKCKDGEFMPPLHLSLSKRYLGNDDDGDAVTSLVLLRGEEPKDERVKTVEKDPGTAIRQTLATLFGGVASGNQLRDACGVKQTKYYEVLEGEIRDGRIERVDQKRLTKYRLTSNATEYVPPPPESSPSPSSGEFANSRRGLAGGVPESESEFASPSPLKGAGADSNSDSRSHASLPHQKNGEKNGPGGVKKADSRGGGRRGPRAKSSPRAGGSRTRADSPADSRDDVGRARDA